MPAVKGRGRTYRHPWDTWFSKSSFQLKKGVHFDCQTHSMVVQVRNAATNRGLKVVIQLFDDTLTVTVRNGRKR